VDKGKGDCQQRTALAILALRRPDTLLTIGAAFALLSGLAWFGLWWNASAGRATESWAQVRCVIVDSQVREYPAHEPDAGPEYTVEVRYRYAFDGREFEGDRYAIVRALLFREEAAREIVDKILPGTESVCYCDPTRPEESVLVRGDPARSGGARWLVSAIFGISLVCVLLGVLEKLAR